MWTYQTTSILLASFISLLFQGRNTLAQENLTPSPPGVQTRFAGPEPTLRNGTGEVPAQNLLHHSVEFQDDPTYRAYLSLRRTGVVFATIGGIMVVVGGVFTGVALGRSCSSGSSEYEDNEMADFGCAIASLAQGVIGSTIMATGGLFFLTPGIVMAVKGHKTLNRYTRVRLLYQRRRAKRPSLKSVSLMTTTSGSKIGGLMLTFAF